ncbi:MAG: hypothetical protein M3162_08450 [Thermoproteota archaeon]|nr:hypothetical protein [Thermoproteota archaeon]
MSSAIDWSEVIKKEARGLDDDDLGEVQGFRDEGIITKVGMIDKETYCIPKNLVERFDGNNLWFKISKEEAKSRYKVAD